jgi:hypothetical protein
VHVKRTLLAMALLVTSVFGVTGCGSDDDVQAESRVKNVAPEASGASDAPRKADCDRLLVVVVDHVVGLDRLDRLRDLDDLRDLRLNLRFDVRAIRVLLDLLDRLDQCAAASDIGADSVTTTMPPASATEPEDDDGDEKFVRSLFTCAPPSICVETNDALIEDGFDE